MTRTIDAVFEQGVFRPIEGESVALPDGSLVRLLVSQEAPSIETGVLDLAARVYEGLSPSDVAEVERIATNRSQFFAP